MTVLVTGGAGFIGSHTIVSLIENGHSVVSVDSLINSDSSVYQRLESITGTPIKYVTADVRDTDKLTELMQRNKIDAVIHFAALKAVGESMSEPLRYYGNNIGGLISVLQAMNAAKVNKLIFSSSATVYGDPDSLPITEEFELKPTTNPYGETKQMAERIIADTAKASDLKAVNLRYFNPVGAHESGEIGELPKGTPNNLVPFVTQAAAGLRDELTVFGDDYDTPDGSGVRDYIHVVDLARAHVNALEFLTSANDDVTALNIGTGSGHSVLEIIKTFEKVNNVSVPHKIGPRRPGDIASCYADPTKAQKLLGWSAVKSLEDALKDAWRWQQKLLK